MCRASGAGWDKRETHPKCARNNLPATEPNDQPQGAAFLITEHAGVLLTNAIDDMECQSENRARAPNSTMRAGKYLINASANLSWKQSAI
jgi:hypothetical protein